MCIIPAISEAVAEGSQGWETSLGHEVRSSLQKKKKDRKKNLEKRFFKFIIRKELNEQKSEEINILHSF